MSESSLPEIGGDHQHWLAELERWEGYLRVWNQQQAALARDIDTLIRQHGQELSEHSQSLETLRREIIDCERAVATEKVVSSAMSLRHGKEATLHDQQRANHERLKAAHHTLMLAQSLLKGEPFREE